MTRKLASIQRITSLTPIDGADKIETARVLGWDVVVGKGEFLVGDFAVFFEIDSFLPASDPRYASFEERFITWNDKRGMRLKTIRLRKQLSQGLLMPINKYPEIDFVVEDRDVTDILKIEKWEATEPNIPGVPNTGKTRLFPSFIRKTDQERIQNISKRVFEAAVAGTKFQVTVKKDGSSMTAYIVRPESNYYKEAVRLRDGKIKNTWRNRITYWLRAKLIKQVSKPVLGLCSRNVQLDLENGSGNFHQAFRDYALADVLEAISEQYGSSVAIQGELVAPTIQRNYEKVSKVEFHVFGMYDIDKQMGVPPNRVEEICRDVGLNHATVLDTGNLFSIACPEGKVVSLPTDAAILMQNLLDVAEGPGDNEGVMREGLVFKALDGSMSFKTISNSYLLKTGK